MFYIEANQQMMINGLKDYYIIFNHTLPVQTGSGDFEISGDIIGNLQAGSGDIKYRK